MFRKIYKQFRKFRNFVIRIRMQVSPYNRGTVPSLKLLHFAKKEDLMKQIGSEHALKIEEKALLDGTKLTAKYLKQTLAEDENFMFAFRNSDLGADAFAKYEHSYELMTNPVTVAKGRAVRAAMAAPKKGFLGCVATKLDPEDFKTCARNCHKPEYQNIEIVPHKGLKQSVYERTANAALAPNPRGNSHISYLPKGLQQYIIERPAEYKDYLKERKAELEFLKTVKKNVQREQEQQLQQLQQQLAEEPGRKRNRN